MPVYKDTNKKGSWYVSCYYKNYQGHSKQKLKRGFPTKKEALAWERDFLETKSGQPTMLFKNLVQLYFADYKTRNKASTVYTKKSMITLHLLPNFGEMQLDRITANDVREWQNKLSPTLSNSYKNSVCATMTAILNYACRYHGLTVNPCKVVSRLPKVTKKMKFYTLEEYRAFAGCITDSRDRLIFDMLYYTGCRIGELMALTWNDIDVESRVMDINKTLYPLPGKSVATSPKTDAGNRVVTLPGFLIQELQDYKAHLYDTFQDDRILHVSKSNITQAMKKYAAAAGLHTIRLHDFRHSHVALLVEMGENPLLIAKRLGHADVKMTLNTYAHLYPNKQADLAQKLDNLK